ENEAGEVLALNVFVAGSNSGVWAKGLWPHMSSLYAVGPQELWPGGKKVNLYQMTTMESLTISTFCHETGHLLCGFPDVYDYDSQSFGGAGLYCVMAYEASATNPQHPCGYLKLVAGWATVTEVRAGAAMTVALPAPSTNGTHLLRYSSPASHEYYVIENRLKTGRDVEIPGSGILVWHVDELGNNSDENLLPNAIHANYEVTLMQADGQWNLQRNQNAGDPNDPFYRGNSSVGYRNRFADDTNPSASWWTGWRSGLELRDFSRLSNSMTLTVEVKSQDIARDPMSQTVILGDDLFLSVQVTLNEPLTYAWYKGNAPVTENERVAGVDGPILSISGMTQSDSGGYSVVITDSLGQSRTSRVAQVTTSNQRRLSAADLGDAGRVSGTTAVLNNVYRISAGGSGVAGAADGARFLHEAISGNFDAKLQVVDMNPEDFRIAVSGAAGIMVRSSLDASSPQASVLIHPGFLDSGRMTAMSRQDRGKPIRVSAEGGGIQPRDNWVRVKREGSLVSMYYSANGTRWEWLDTVTLPLEASALVGIAVSSYNPVIRVVAGVRSYQVQTNVPSTVALNSVKNSAQEGTTERAVISFVSSKNGPLEVPYTLRDAAANGVLYESISGTLSIPEGTNVAFLEFVPINNSTSDPPHVATVTVTAAGVAQGSASAVIFDDDARGVGLKRESYVIIPGTAVADLLRHYRYPGTAQLGTVPVFESTSSQSGGQILSGYLTPPTSGEYVFYLASANGSELWLSSDSNPENEVKIAEELSANTKRNWAGYGSQTHISAPILLTEGKWYSVKAIHKSGLGSPHLAVTWKLPGGEAPENQSAPIGGEFLSWTIPSNAGEVGSRVLLTRSNAGRLLLLSENSSTNRFQLEASTDLRYWQTISLQFSGAETELLTLDPESGTMAHRFYRLQQE
ncbi:MAG TPA: PA14 domain-containing protein, partial [Chthoniobacteraceae bacterium]|nr:PA14 domain-containing protein [Chthoniobacteraceae bacterium]